MNSRILRLLYLISISFILMATMPSCGPNKNTALSRRYQEFITRYNIHYNGETHYEETLDKMETSYADDYSRRVFMHPVEAKSEEGVPQPSGDFNRSIEKAQKAIQLRSIKKKPKKKSGKKKDPKYKEWLQREEYNPFLHNSWMMMARSQFYNGDFLGAASTFFYISKHFGWLPNTVTEARLYQALSYINLGWSYDAEVIITRIKEDELTNKTLRSLYNFVYADFYLHNDNYESALPYLEIAAKTASGAQKTRLRFLLGQVYARLGLKAEAYKAFGAAGSSSSTSYRTKFNARIAQSEVFTGDNIESEVKALKRMTRYDRNKEYLDQIYYAIGNLYLSRQDTANAIKNYILANEKSTRSGIEKAMNQLTLGGIYFNQRKYDLAQPCYSEAIPQLPKNYPNYDILKRRSDVLDELAVYAGNVTLQDSLLRLAAMTPEQQMEVIQKIIDDLKEQEKKAAEDAAREEYLANQAAQGNQLQDNTQQFTLNTDNSWYFYNTATRNAGKTDFQRRWGSRKLEDDWRRRNKATFNTSDFDADDDSDNTIQENNSQMLADTDSQPAEKSNEEASRASDPHFPEYYLAQIPKTDEEIATANDVIQEGLFNMAVILKDKLEDTSAARAQFDQLSSRYPDNIYRLDTYYNLYLMYMRSGDADEAETFRQKILSDFPDSPYGIALLDPEYINKLRSADAEQEQRYEDAYQAYLDNRNSDVHKAYEDMERDYPTGKLMPRFMFLHALAFVTEDQPEEFNAVLRSMLERYPQTELSSIVSSWLAGMAKGKELSSGVSNMRAMIWDMKLSNDSSAIAAEGPAFFELNPNTKQLLVFTFATDQVNSNELLFQVASHNFKAFAIKDFDLEQMNFGRLGMLIIRGFENMSELNQYRQVAATTPEFILPAGVRPIAISETDFKTLLDQGRSFEEYFQFRNEQNYIDAQEGLIPVQDIETLSDAEEKSKAIIDAINEAVTAEDED